MITSIITTATHPIIHYPHGGISTVAPPRRCHFSTAALRSVDAGEPRHRFPTVLARAGGDGGGSSAEANPKIARNGTEQNMSSGKGYIGLFVQMLGLDNDPVDREQAIVTLWNYSQGGKNHIDEIMQFPGCTKLVVNLLKSDSSTTCEAAAGFLQTVSSVNLYRNMISESGAIEELTSLLCKCPLASEVKEQSLCTLWNLSIDEKPRLKLANSDFLPILVKFLEDEDTKVKEAAGGILANLSLDPSNHRIMVEAGVIPKLAKLLKINAEGFRVIRKEAKFTLLELAKDEYYRILIIEEGMIRVPVIGIAAYKSFRPTSHSWPSLPDGTELQRSSRPSRFGASELLLGLSVDEKLNLEEAKMNAIVGRSHQQFLARIGAIELEHGDIPQVQASRNQEYTLLSWIDGIARLVLILGLEDVSAVTRAAYSIADASISEHMRLSFRVAGAVKPLVQLLSHDSEATQEAVAYALEKLCVSYDVRHTMEAEGVLIPLINIIKRSATSTSLVEKTVNILSRFFDSTTRVKKRADNHVINGSAGMLSSTNSHNVRGPARNMDISLESAREKVIDSDVISCLINILRTSSPQLQKKVASVLEYISTFEIHATTIMNSGIETALDAVFQQACYGNEVSTDDQLEVDQIESEEIGHATDSAARLLTKLLNYDNFHRTVDCTHFLPTLQKILKSPNVPLHCKDWIAACLVKLESLLGQPVDIEVTLYERIPRLVEQMMESFSYELKEAAAIELSQILSKGGVEYTRAVASAGGIFPLVNLIKEGRGEALEASLAILYNLSMDSENHAAIIAAGAVPVLKRIVVTKGPQWDRALCLLRTLPT